MMQQSLFIVDWFLNVFNSLFFVIAVVIGILLGIVILRFGLKPKNQILYFRERDGRGEELNVVNEDAISLETTGSPEMRFFKYGRSYEFRKRGRAFTRFLGKEGTAYTWQIQGFNKVPTKFDEITESVPVLNEVGKAIVDEKGKPVFKDVKRKVAVEFEEKQIILNFPTLQDAVISKWGEDFYKEVPDHMKDLLRENNLLVTVNLEPGLTPDEYKPISEKTIKKKAVEDILKLLAYHLKGAIKEPMIKWIFAVGTGCAIGWIANTLLGVA